MSITRTDVQSFFINLGLQIESSQVMCFRCNNPLKYHYRTYTVLNTTTGKQQTYIEQGYKCSLNHLYNYQTVVHKFSLALYDLKTTLDNEDVCSF